MSTKTIVWSLAGVMALGAFGYAWRVRCARDANAATMAELRAKQDSLEASARKQQGEIAELEKQRTELEAIAARMKTATPVLKAAGPPPRMLNLTQNPMELMAKDPKLQVLYLAARRASVAASYGPLFRKLGLSPEQIDRIAVAMTKAEEQRQDAAAIQRDQKLPADDPGLVALHQRATEELLAIQRDVLGVDGVEQLRRYQQTLPARAIVDRFAGAAVFADLALTGAQADQLTQAMADASSSYQDGAGTADVAKIDWEKVDARAATFLTPPQLALFQRIEPLGGGMSRWNARFNAAFNQALDHARKSAEPTKPSGG